MSDQEKPAARLHILFAADAPIAVILRTGPSRHTQMWLWETDCDRFTPGQWFKQNIYPIHCKIHPSGRYVFLRLADYRWRRDLKWQPSVGAYDVVSRPPYFTALAFLPEHEVGSDQVRIEPGCPAEIQEWISGLRFFWGQPTSDWIPENPSGYMGALRSWFKAVTVKLSEGETTQVLKGNDFDLIRRSQKGNHGKFRFGWAYSVIRGGQETNLGEMGEYNVDQGGRLIVWKDGQVFQGDWVDDTYIERLLIDLNDQVFEEVQAPNWAKTWTDSE